MYWLGFGILNSCGLVCCCLGFGSWCVVVVLISGVCVWLLLFELGFGYLVVDLCGFDC